MSEKTLEKIRNHCDTRGFIFPGSEIYGGLANTWDYGPLGVELKNNVKRAWWKKFVQESPTNVGVDCAILMNTNVWVASGHVGGFSDPLMDCKSCKARHRADQLIEGYFAKHHSSESPAGWTNEQMEALIEDLSNTKDKVILGCLNDYPFMAVKAHTRPFERKWLNVTAAIIVPVGLFLYLRMWRFRLRLLHDLKVVKDTNDAVIRRITELKQGN